MALKQQIQDDLKEALKRKEEVKTGTLRMVLASLVNKEKEKGEELVDEQVQEVVMTEAKKRRESIEAFEKGGRQELADKEKTELEVLQTYLPEQLSEEEVRALVKEAVESTGASAKQDMGKVMSALMPKVKGRADGALVSKLVHESLQGL